MPSRVGHPHNGTQTIGEFIPQHEQNTRVFVYSQLQLEKPGVLIMYCRMSNHCQGLLLKELVNGRISIVFGMTSSVNIEVYAMVGNV